MAAKQPNILVLWGDDIGQFVSRGLYLDLPPWGYHVFAVTAV